MQNLVVTWTWESFLSFSATNGKKKKNAQKCMEKIHKKEVCRVYCLGFFLYVTEIDRKTWKHTKKDDFNQQSATAPICWSKYTTVTKLWTKDLAVFVLSFKTFKKLFTSSFILYFLLWTIKYFTRCLNYFIGVISSLGHFIITKFKFKIETSSNWAAFFGWTKQTPLHLLLFTKSKLLTPLIFHLR